MDDLRSVPWFVWLGLAWIALIGLFVWMNQRFWQRFGEQMKPWEDEHRDGGIG